MARKKPTYQDKLAAHMLKIGAWRDLVAKEATITARAVLELFAEQHLRLPKDQAEFKADLSEASAAAGDLIAKKVVESLITTAPPSAFARLSRAYKTGEASNSPNRKHKGAEPAQWKTKALAVLKDRRRKLLDKGPDIIIDALYHLRIIDERNGAYFDVATGSQCARDKKDMRAQVCKLVKKAVDSKEIAE